MSDAVTGLRTMVAQLVADGRAEGIEPDGPLGRWLEGQARALTGLADILEGQSTRIETVLGRLEAASKVELQKLGAELEAAGRIGRQGELALRQARQVQVALVAEKEEVVDRMVRETLPMFVQRLQSVLVIREQRWNVERRRRGYALAGAVALGVFLAGFGLSSWGDSGPAAAFDRCVAHAFVSGGHTYCQIDQFFAGSRSR